MIEWLVDGDVFVSVQVLQEFVTDFLLDEF